MALLARHYVGHQWENGEEEENTGSLLVEFRGSWDILGSLRLEEEHNLKNTVPPVFLSLHVLGFWCFCFIIEIIAYKLFYKDLWYFLNYGKTRVTENLPFFTILKCAIQWC